MYKLTVSIVLTLIVKWRQMANVSVPESYLIYSTYKRYENEFGMYIYKSIMLYKIT